MEGGDGGVIFEGSAEDPSSTTAARCCGRARGGVHGGHTSAAWTRSLGTTSPAPVGPAARTLAQTSHGRAAAVCGVVQQSRGPAAGRSSAAPLRVLEGAAGAHVREQEEGLLARREGAAARVPT